MKYLISLFAKPQAGEVAMRKLRDAELQLLDVQDAVEYSTALAGYHSARIRRLKAHIGKDATA